jgi:TatD DNase family protein
MNFTDTHTHLFAKEFDSDRNQVIENAIKSGITKMILPCIKSSDIEILNKLAKEYPKNIFPSVGLHPSEVKENFEEELSIIFDSAKLENYIAIGETGIDLYWDKTFIDIQKISFEKQIIFAKEMKLPIIIHVREAFDEVFEIVDKHHNENLFGVFHSFTGNINEAKHICEYGNFKMGINGIVTFKKSGLDKIISEIDINKIILETDSPYLSPSPKRGMRNESSHIIYIAEKIAENKNIDLKELSEITNKNAIELFGNRLKN